MGRTESLLRILCSGVGRAVRKHVGMGKEATNTPATNFKMRLFSPTDGISGIQAIQLYKASNGKRFNVVQLIADYLQLLKNDALRANRICQRVAGVTEKDILRCVSVPAHPG